MRLLRADALLRLLKQSPMDNSREALTALMTQLATVDVLDRFKNNDLVVDGESYRSRLKPNIDKLPPPPAAQVKKVPVHPPQQSRRPPHARRSRPRSITSRIPATRRQKGEARSPRDDRGSGSTFVSHLVPVQIDRMIHLYPEVGHACGDKIGEGRDWWAVVRKDLAIDSPDIDALVACSDRVAEAMSQPKPAAAGARTFFMETLHKAQDQGGRDLWGCFVDGLITECELRDGTMARCATWLSHLNSMSDSEPSTETWCSSEIERDFELALFGRPVTNR